LSLGLVVVGAPQAWAKSSSLQEFQLRRCNQRGDCLFAEAKAGAFSRSLDTIVARGARLEWITQNGQSVRGSQKNSVLTARMPTLLTERVSVICHSLSYFVATDSLLCEAPLEMALQKTNESTAKAAEDAQIQKGSPARSGSFFLDRDLNRIQLRPQKPT
jgi:hypothetical protein